MKYSRVLLLCILVLGLSSCETDDTEYWLSGTWAGQVGARDASFIFNENRTGSYRIEGGDSGTFDWYFEDEQYWDAPSGTIILDFGHKIEHVLRVHGPTASLFPVGIMIITKTIWRAMMVFP